MDAQFTYDQKVTLPLPPAELLKSIKVHFSISPKDAKALVYGHQPDGTFSYVEVGNSDAPVSLPFCRPEIFIKYRYGLKDIVASLVGFDLR